MLGLNESQLNNTCTQYIQGNITSHQLISYFSQHVFVISLLLLVIIPALFLLLTRSSKGKIDRNTFWIIYVLSEIIAVILLLLILFDVIPIHLIIG